MTHSKSFITASIGVTITMIIGFVLSFGKEAIIANYYGVSWYVDAYTIAIQIPISIFSFVTVAVQSVVIPIYSDIYYNKGAEESKQYIDRLLTVLVAFTLVFIGLGVVFSDALVYLFAPGFNTETHELSSNLLKICLCSTVISIIAQVLIAVLNVHKIFVLPSCAIYFTNIGIILFVIFCHAKYGIISACWGQIIGDILRLFFLILLVKKVYHYSCSFNHKDDRVVKTLKLSVPVLWSVSISEISTVVNRIVGSFLLVGSIAAITYATKITTVLMQLFVSAIATIVYPMFAESAAKNDIDQLNRRINMTLSVYSLFVIPLMFGAFIYKREIIEIAFARGAFNANAVELTQALLGIYAVGLLFFAFRSTVTNIYYSQKDTKTPAVNATIGTVINIILNIVLAYFWGIYGLAAATTITGIYISTTLIIQLVKKDKKIQLNNFYFNLRSIVVSAIVMFVIVYFIHTIFEVKSPIMNVLIGLLGGILIYFIMLLLTKNQLISLMINLILNKKKNG